MFFMQSTMYKTCALTNFRKQVCSNKVCNMISCSWSGYHILRFCHSRGPPSHSRYSTLPMKREVQISDDIENYKDGFSHRVSTFIPILFFPETQDTN